ncbi:hypothetical protein ACXYX3_17620 [Mycobacterium sp. C3-094]
MNAPIVGVGQVELVVDLEVTRCQPYEPVTACTACSHVDRHHAAPAPDGFVQRTCTRCLFRWRQFSNRLFTKGI